MCTVRVLINKITRAIPSRKCLINILINDIIKCPVGDLPSKKYSNDLVLDLKNITLTKYL